MTDAGCRVANVPVAKVRILKGVWKGRYDGDVMHLGLDKAHDGEAKGEYEILEVLEPGMPNP
jgi:hypothetical protein